MARPSIYTDELAAIVCDRLATGESLRSICEDSDMPNRDTITRWDTEDREGFSSQYTRARQDQANYYADQIIEIADELEHAETNEEINAARVRIDARKWKSARMAPENWGDKSTVNHEGEVTVTVKEYVYGD